MLTVTQGDLNTLSKKTFALKDYDIDMYAWIVDGSGKYTGLAWLGMACDNGKYRYPRCRTSVTRGPSRYNAIIETAEVSSCNSFHLIFSCENNNVLFVNNDVNNFLFLLDVDLGS